VLTAEELGIDIMDPARAAELELEKQNISKSE